jgi:hypothetical protein
MFNLNRLYTAEIDYKRISNYRFSHVYLVQIALIKSIGPSRIVPGLKDMLLSLL